MSKTKPNKSLAYEVRPNQSVELLKELHILTADGKMNQDSRRKLKQVYHLFQFIEPLLTERLGQQERISLVDHGAGKSYLGFNYLIYSSKKKPIHRPFMASKHAMIWSPNPKHWLSIWVLLLA